ncbi:hypothetical protein AKJ16_DCAP15899, partial [Drosera capensis]
MPWKSISRMVLIYVVLNRLSSSLAILNSQDPKTGWLFKFSATVVAGVAVVAYVWRHTWTRINPSQDVGTSQDTDDDPEVICSCGLRARLRVCRTAKNPYRLFYNCPKHISRNQCDFFCWCDEMSITLDRCQEEKTFLRDECIRLQERINYLRSRREHDRVVWETEKSDLTSKFSAVQAELDDIKSRIQQVIESDVMPPFDDSCKVDDEPDGAVVIGTTKTFVRHPVNENLPFAGSDENFAHLRDAPVLNCMIPEQQPCLGACGDARIVVDSVLALHIGCTPFQKWAYAALSGEHT